MNRVYLDHNATTAIEPPVLDAMLPCLSGDVGNAASSHTLRQRAGAGVEPARKKGGGLFGARARETVSPGGGGEADHHGLFGVCTRFVTGPASRAANLSDDLGKRFSIAHLKHVITTNIEHEAVLN